MPKDWYYFDDHLTGETTTLTTGETATVISPNEWRIKGRCGYYTCLLYTSPSPRD